MPNAGNIDRPILLVGAGRTATTYFLDRLQYGRCDFQSLIENTIYTDLYRILTTEWWSVDWQYVCTQEERDRRIVYLIRQAFLTLFPSDRPYWAMKCIWASQNVELLDRLFPLAKYFHLVRDPRTNIPSMMERIGWTFDEACRTYVEANLTALKFQRFRGRYCRVRQEDFIDHRNQTWTRIDDFLGIPQPETEWEHYLNVSPSQEGKVETKRADDHLDWKDLPEDVLAMAEVLEYREVAVPGTWERLRNALGKIAFTTQPP